MDIYQKTIEEIDAKLKSKIRVVEHIAALNDLLAKEFCDLLEERTRQRELLTVICPVGPVDYSCLAMEMKRRDLSGKWLRTINMDDYVDDNGQLIPTSHPLSFRTFMNDTFFRHLPEKDRPAPENIVFPDPMAPEKVTALIDSIGGADICWAGFGISGHIAFNDPPAMLGETHTLNALRTCKTRIVTCCQITNAQMAMGGTNGNWEILPKRGVTLGMYEMLKSKKFHSVFMRNWHAGLWRRAFLGPVTCDFPGSLLQEHSNIEITMTKLAAALPMVKPSQETGENYE